MSTTRRTRRPSAGSPPVPPGARAAAAGSIREIEPALRHAIAKRELSVAFQPQVSLSTGMMVGAEALVRWHREGPGMVPADLIIALAEANGLIDLVDEFVLDQACSFAVELRRAWLPEARVAVNISARQCGDLRTVDRVEAALLRSGLPAAALEIEISESAFEFPAKAVGTVLEELSRLGVRLSMDDFGAGSAGLRRLTQFRVDRIKVDRALLDEVHRHRTQQAIAHALMFLAKQLGYDLIAEGIERRAQWQWLADNGCREAQGFAIARPQQRDHLLARGHALFQARS